MPSKDQDGAETSASTAKGTGKKPAVYVCEICRSRGLDARYSRIEYLNRHERTHTETKPFQCEYCGKRYARSDVLFRHRRKCPQTLQNAKSAGATSDSAASSSRSRARTDARPYPGLNSEADSLQNSSRTSSSRPLTNGVGYPSPVIYKIFDKPQHKDVHGSPPTPEDVVFDLSISPELLPSMNGNVVQLSQASVPQEQHPFRPSTPIDNRQIHEMLDNVPSFSNSPFLSSSTLQHNQFGHSEPPPTGDENRVGTRPNNSIAPEQTLLSTELEICRQKCGPQKIDASNPFFFDPSRMMYCYMVDKWNMPSCSKMSALAYRTYNSILGHIGVFHMPTFRLNDAHIWVSFAMCTTDSVDPDLRKAPMTEFGSDPAIQSELEELGADSPWVRGQKVVQKEKTEIIVKALYSSQKLTKLGPDDALPLIHALLLYNSKTFLSENRTERLSGEAYLATIISVARTAGILNPGTACTAPRNPLTTDWEPKWKQWIYYESWRRTAWFVYILDTIASLDKGAKTQVATRDVRHIPLPCPTTIWHAATAKDWWDGIMDLEFSCVPLDNAVNCLANAPLQKAHIKRESLSKRELGPYARHILILTLMRGIIDYGVGKPQGGYITKRWILPRVNDPLPIDILALHNAIISTYTMMLNNWRQGWDLDAQCHTNYRGTHFINDALPPYWLCRALLDRLSPPPPAYVPNVVYCTEDDVFEEDGPNRLQDVNLSEMFQMSRQFVSHGEGLGVPLSTYDPVPGGPGTENLPTAIDPSSIGVW